METKIFSLLAALLVLSAVTICTAAGVTEDIANSGTSTLRSESTTSIPTTTDSIINGSNETTGTTSAPLTATNNSPTTIAPTSIATTSVSSTAAPTTSRNTAVTTGIVPTTSAPIGSATTEISSGTTYYYSTHEPTTPTPCPKRSFDAASFVGGIVLGLGLLGISIFIYKWYQSKHQAGAPYHQF